MNVNNVDAIYLYFSQVGMLGTQTYTVRYRTPNLSSGLVHAYSQVMERLTIFLFMVIHTTTVTYSEGMFMCVCFRLGGYRYTYNLRIFSTYLG